ncbi:hypothetical protein O0I10_003612 [Lichtheimia ornata]|uniref:Leucine-rich repeat and WD repeat-containing protein 1 WD domain-containing protein n=1 Tax=Lichtheimia ornata TaxID=688661 RepID=A0AAD7V7Z1_9FUNG|nr:uncharacterized protein O0I10_003612 [Lichtheimia ornata]KAJ8660565.1 hypothetical protein O0I10_003612 [Lichtheimia ornata]
MVEKSTTRKRAQAKPTDTATGGKRARLGGTSNSSTALPSTRLSTSTTVNTTSTTTTPRPRGRPPKNPNAPPTSNVDTPPPPTQPRPRGRPPKNPNATTSTTTPSSKSANDSTVKSRQEQVRAQEVGIVRPTSKIMRRPAPKEQASTTPSATGTTATDKGTAKPKASTARASTTSTKDTPSTATKRTTKTPSRATKQVHPVLPIIKSPFKLQYMMQGHVEEDARTERANLWGCEYEPGTNVVAVCGGDMILFLDVQQGRYVKKYSHVESNEEFRCLAWTLLKGSKDLRDDEADEDDKCTVLAAAGRLGSIKLVNALQNQCFRHLFGHGKQIRKLQFSKAHPRWLFSASDDMSVRLWDIGTPNNKQENNSACLAKFMIPTKLSVPTAINAFRGNLMVGCAEGDLVHFDMKDAGLDKLVDKEVDGGAGTIVKNKIVYPAGDEWHEGYVDDIYILGQHGGNPHPLDGCIVSRGVEDYEILVWKHKSSTKKDADIAISLEWPESVDEVGLRFKVIERHDQKVIVAGDYDGQIRLYNFGDGKLSKTLEDNSKEMFQPTKVLSHPKSSGLIRDVCVSEDTSTIVAVDSNNHIFVWSCS